MSRLDKKKGFTLFELMIVIVIIGVVYGLLVRNFTFASTSEEALSLKNLPTFMRKKFAKTKEKVEFLCTDECSICKFKVGSSDANESIELFEEYTSPEAYVLINESLERLEFGEIFKDYKSEKVCFKYVLYPNKSSDKMVLAYKDKVYMYDNFFEKTKEFPTLVDAQEYWNEWREKAKED